VGESNRWNNYAISTADLAESLTKSSGSLVAANGTLEEAVALTATANTIIQNADVVGTALKTVAMRLRGTSVEILSEEGLDTDGAIESMSKLQDKIKALSGVDILTDAGSYKSTYQILAEIAEVWKDISDIDQAALLEVLAGKRAGSVMAAILQNPDTLKDAFESAQNASGSALKENEKYLDSIQGKIDQFNNSVQTMWMNLLNSKIIKHFVDRGTKIVSSLDTIPGKILAIVKALALLMAYKKINPFESISNIFNSFQTNGFGATIKNLAGALIGVKTVMKSVTAETLANTIATQTNDAVKTKQIMTELGLAGATGTLDQTQKQAIATKILDMMTTNQLSMAQGNAMLAMLGYAGATMTADGSLKILDATTKSFMATNPIGWILLIVSAIMSVVMWLSSWSSTTEKLEEDLKNLNSEISSMKSDIDSLNSELETTRDRMAELLSMDSLSFVEQEELENLKLQNAELERQLKLQEALLKNKEAEQKEKAKEVVASKWDGKYFDKEYDIGSYGGTYGIIGRDKWYTSGKSGKEVLSTAIPLYSDFKKKTDDFKKIYEKALEAQKNNEKIDLETFRALKIETAITTEKSQWKNMSDDELQKELDARYNAKKYDDTETIEEMLDDVYDHISIDDITLSKMESGINMVLNDMSKVIDDNGLSYSMNDEEINKFLDEYYAYSLKFANAQGSASKSSVISAIWDNTESEGMKELKEDLDEITDSEDDRAIKEQKAQTLIQQALDDTTGKYERLKTFMESVGITAEEMASYFVSASEAPDIKTMAGIFQVFSDGEEILKKYKEERDAVLGQDENGEDITWNNLFTDGSDGKEADGLKVAAILEGSDEAIREQFTKLLEEVENGKMSVDEALARWEMVGIDKAVANLNEEFESINNEMFADVADEISGLIDTVKELQAALESVSGTMDTLHTAQEQMNSSGRISVKTALELMTATDEWDKILNITEDSITLKDNAEQELIQTQLDSIKVQTQRSAELAKEKYEAALAAQAERELNNAEKNVANTQNTANAVTHERVIQEAGLETQIDNTTAAEKQYAANGQVVQTAESVKAKAVGLVASAIVGLDAAITAFVNASWGNKFGAAASAWSSAYNEARNAVIADANSLTTTVEALGKDYERKKGIADVFGNVDDYSSFKNYYDYDETPGDKYSDSGSDNEIDWLEHYFTSIENKIKEKEADLENVMSTDVGSIDDKNTIIDGIIDLYESKIPLLENAINAYKNRATTLFNSFSSDIQNKILNGSIKISEYGDELAEDIQNYFDYITNASDLEIELDGIKVTVADFSLQKFDNASTAFDNEIEEKFQSDQDLIEAEIGYLEEQGKRVSPELYEKLIDIQKDEQEVLENKKKTLENILATEIAAGHIQIGSEQWYEMTNAINDVDEALIESKNDLESFQNSINEICWDNFEKLTDQIDAVDSELSNLFDLLSEDDKVVDEFGNWTDEGIASLGLLAQQMENAQAKADEYAKAIKQLDKDYVDGKYSLDEYNEKMAELKDGQLSEIKNIEDLKDAMVDLNKVRVDAVKEAIDKEIEALEEKNEKLKESLDLEKEQYEWQKSVAEKEKSIADIQRRLNALAGDNSSSAIAERRKLQSELAAAQQEMDDMWYEHSIEEQQKTLDESLENYKENKEDEKEALDKWLEEEEKVIQESFDLFNSNVGVVSSVLSAFEQEHGIKLSEAVTDPWKSGIDAMEAYRQKLSEMKQEQESAKQNAEDTADDIIESLDKPVVSAPTVKPNTDTTTPSQTTQSTESTKPTVDTTPSYREYTIKTNDTLSGIAKSELGSVSRWQEIYNLNKDVISNPNLIYPGQKIKLPHYARGTMGAEYDHWAMVDELGPELQLVPDGSGRLSYITRGTSVIPHDLSEKLVDLALDPTKVLEQSRPKLGAPHITTNNMEINLQINEVVHIDHADSNSIQDITNAVQKQMDQYMKNVNQSLKRFTR
jgi:LysM repeat protein